jgi:hypothetical protein
VVIAFSVTIRLDMTRHLGEVEIYPRDSTSNLGRQQAVQMGGLPVHRAQFSVHALDRRRLFVCYPLNGE